MRLHENSLLAQRKWETPEYVANTLSALGINASLRDVVQCGCGRGTLTIPIARAVSGIVYAFDNDPAMVEWTRKCSISLRIVCLVREVIQQGFYYRGVDAALLFNVLPQDPLTLLNHAADAVEPGGHVFVTHWRHGANPHGPRDENHLRPEQVIRWACETGRLKQASGVIDLSPWQYGLRFRST